MTSLDIAFGFLAGIVSCLTPEALLLFPLIPAAAGAEGRASVIAPAVGLGLSLVLTGFVAGPFTSLTGIDFRLVACALLFLLGFILLSASLVERFPRLTGGRGDIFGADGATSFGSAFRLSLLAIIVGANWYPMAGPTLIRASAMAADIWYSGLALAVLFAFGMGAAAPWIFLGRVIRLLLRPFGGDVLHGMAGKRLLGVTLLAVAILGSTRLESVMTHWLSGLLPDWTRKLATTF
jgi:cytochrome c biogenesis protein CcdA